MLGGGNYFVTFFHGVINQFFGWNDRLAACQLKLMLPRFSRESCSINSLSITAWIFFYVINTLLFCRYLLIGPSKKVNFWRNIFFSLHLFNRGTRVFLTVLIVVIFPKSSNFIQLFLLNFICLSLPR